MTFEPEDDNGGSVKSRGIALKAIGTQCVKILVSPAVLLACFREGRNQYGRGMSTGAWDGDELEQRGGPDRPGLRSPGELVIRNSD